MPLPAARCLPSASGGRELRDPRESMTREEPRHRGRNTRGQCAMRAAHGGTPTVSHEGRLHNLLLCHLGDTRQNNQRRVKASPGYYSMAQYAVFIRSGIRTGDVVDDLHGAILLNP